VGVLGPSSVPAFQDALKAQLEARPNLVGLSICIGPPPPGISQELKWLAFLEVDGTEVWSAMGRRQKEEQYTQKIYVSVITRDGERDSTYGRDIAYLIRQEVADQLLADPTVNSTVWQAQVTKKQEFYPRLGVTVPDDEHGQTVDLSWREACLYFDIFVKNRI